MQYIYAIKDTVVGEFQNLFVCPNDSTAVRVFSSSINTLRHPLRQIYKDVDLYRLGSIDLNTGSIFNICDSINGFEFLIHGENVYKTCPIDVQEYAEEIIKAERDKILCDAEDTMYESK